MTSFESIQESMINKGGKSAEMVLSMRKSHDEHQKEICALCGRRRDEHDLRGLIYFSDDLKAGWSCVEKLVIANRL